jgi:hypothetical protein
MAISPNAVTSFMDDTAFPDAGKQFPERQQEDVPTGVL